jgi:glycosyltransferase involved in cell wall biosynthesis
LTRPKVLYLLHNHPALYPGGAEAYALELYQAMRDAGEFSPGLLARIGPDVTTRRDPHPGTPFSMVGRDPNQYFLYTDTDGWDGFYGTHRDSSLYFRHLDSFLAAHQPDLVHFQHTFSIGYDAVTLVRRVLPEVPIVYTLHEFWPICHRGGQMLRSGSEKPCMHESPRRCHECFPSIPMQDFFLRKRAIQAHLSNVDCFIAPSHFLRERYIDWGIPAERIVFEDYGRLPTKRASTSRGAGPRTRLGFFGQLNFFKGVNVLLDAMLLLAERDVDVELRLHGANLDLQPEGFQAEFRERLAETGERVTLHGRYQHEQLPGLMADIDWVVVPSIWWENSPLVIQEAFRHGRPVICSDIGGMAEKVDDQVNGLHFRSGDPASLAGAIETAVTDERLWNRLRAGIAEVHDMHDHLVALTRIYRQLVAGASDGAGRHSEIPRERLHA